MTLWSHIERNQPLSKSQLSFRKGRSIETNHIESYDFVKRILDGGLPVDVMFLDQAKAFDKVQHELLLLKLDAYRVRDYIIAWIKAFLIGKLRG